MIDTLRADHVGAYGYKRGTTPRIDRIVERGVLFERAVAASSWTQPSMASLFTSTYPMVHQVIRTPVGQNTMSVLPSDLVTIAEFMKEQGFKTQAVSSHPYCSALSGFDQGFDGFETVSDIMSEYEPAEVMDRALGWIKAQNSQSKFFLYIHIMGPHWPYAPPPEFQNRYTSEKANEVKELFQGMDYKRQKEFMLGQGVSFFRSRPDLLNELVGLYDEEIAFSDMQAGRLWDELESRNMLDGTMLVICSDHGEGFLVHNRFWHGNSLFRELVDVPLVIYYPPLGEGLRAKEIVSLIDVFPALIDLFKAEPPHHMQGVSFLQFIRGGKAHDPVLSELLIMGQARLTTPRHSLIFSPRIKVQKGGETYVKSRDEIYLYDLTDDPDELKNTAHHNPDLTRELVDTILEMERQNRKIKIKPGKPRSLDQELRQKLTALGYLH